MRAGENYTGEKFFHFFSNKEKEKKNEKQDKKRKTRKKDQTQSTRRRRVAPSALPAVFPAVCAVASLPPTLPASTPGSRFRFTHSLSASTGASSRRPGRLPFCGLRQHKLVPISAHLPGRKGKRGRMEVKKRQLSDPLIYAFSRQHRSRKRHDGLGAGLETLLQPLLAASPFPAPGLTLLCSTGLASRHSIWQRLVHRSIQNDAHTRYQRSPDR